jgi:hypothetical protein
MKTNREPEDQHNIHVAHNTVRSKKKNRVGCDQKFQLAIS